MLGLIAFVASAVMLGAPAQTTAEQDLLAQQDAATQQEAAQDAAPAKSDFSGVIGMCVRWKAGAEHVDDAVVINPSSNAALNQSSAATIKTMAWAAPANYAGGWLGVNLAIGGAVAPAGRPDCSALKG